MHVLKLLNAVVVISLLTGQAFGAPQESVRERLRQQIESAGSPPSLQVGNDLIYCSIALPLFYERRAYEPAWVLNGTVTPLVDELLSSIRSADSQGLRSTDYHLRRIETVVKKLHRGTEPGYRLDYGLLVDLELLCTDAFLIYGSHLLSGRVDPHTIDVEWYANRREADLAGILQSAIEQNSVDSILNTLLPPQTGYALLVRALADYRQLEQNGGWDSIPAGPGMKPGSQGERVLFLRRRLERTGDLRTSPLGDSSAYDASLEVAVIAFQRRHGLKADGIVGPVTLATLNVPVEERIIQIITNLERWRWLPQNLGQRHLLVNIANFELDAIKEDSTIVSMRVIVGKSYRRTPVFSDRITYMVLNPSWNVPHLIAVQDILPLARVNPNYLAENDFELITGWGTDMTIVDPISVDWTDVSDKRFNYRLRQKSGSKNALGSIKFMFPNQFDVYLHDTPARGLFAREKRDFSSGCIRVEDPMAVAEFLLEGDHQWTMMRLKSQLAAGQEQTIRIQKPVPIHILYWTAWVTPDGIVHFRDDIYDRDKPLITALLEEPPGVE